MADLLGGIPFGVDQIVVNARLADGTLATNKIDVFGATSISLSLDSDVQEARGNNVSRRKMRSNKSLSGGVGMLQHDPTILAVVGDGVTSAEGTTPDIITTYVEPEKPVTKRYQIEAQSYDGAGATRLTIFNASTSSGPNFDWSTDSYSEPGWEYEATGFTYEGTLALYMVQVFETGEEIEMTNPVGP